MRLALVLLATLLLASPAGALEPRPFTLYFQAGTVQLTTQEGDVKWIADYLRQATGRTTIHGHTDGAEKRAGMVALARTRVLVLRDELVALGIPNDRLQLDWADDVDAVPAAPTASEPLNRRVVIDLPS